MEIKQYLQSLDAETLKVVAIHMIADQFGLARPDGGNVCNPPCSGDGSTPNGYWVCSSGNRCVWVPIV